MRQHALSSRRPRYKYTPAFTRERIERLREILDEQRQFDLPIHPA